MIRRHRLSRGGRLALLALPVLGACSNAGEDLGFGAIGNGEVTAFVFLDRDGSLTTLATPGFDTVLAGIRVGVVPLGTNDTVASGVTDALGLVTMASVPLGDYRLVVDTTTVGDSVAVQAFSKDTIRLRAKDTRDTVSARVGFPVGKIGRASCRERV